MQVEENTTLVQEETPKKSTWKRELLEWVASILIAVVLALTIREFVFTLVKVQGESMEPSLHNADRLYVNRLFYKPEKGDVVIFVPHSHPDHPYVKRVIATEGDTLYIDFETGDVYVNDELVEEPYIKEKTRRTGHYILSLMAKGQYSKEHPITIKEGHIFAMGDNRNNSQDSRELGQIPVEEIMGGAVFRFWPLDNIGTVHDEAEQVSYLADSVYGLE